jgi:predicted Zn finger-like uncharacterized protein
MKTRCPNCRTVFRITQEQIAAHSGKVRCGCCRGVFNALDDLIGERLPAAVPPPAGAEPMFVDASPQTIMEFASPSPVPGKRASSSEDGARTEPAFPPADTHGRMEPAGGDALLNVTPGLEDGPIIPRETNGISGYGKWAEGVMAPSLEIPAEKPPRWPFGLAVALLALVLAGQALSHFRGELAISVPGLRPVLEAFSSALGDPLPLPKHADLVSIESSDLQTDPARGNLLVLNATLRNKAHYGQAWPSLELSLTDTQDTVIARRIFTPQDYLPTGIVADPAFPGDSDFAVRLWIEAVDLAASGYRLLVFYP